MVLSQGTDCTILNQINVSSVTRLGTGRYRVTFTSNFSNSSYVTVITLKTTANIHHHIESTSTSSITISVKNDSNKLADINSNDYYKCSGF